jgi:hypothetical protein
VTVHSLAELASGPVTLRNHWSLVVKTLYVALSYSDPLTVWVTIVSSFSQTMATG